MQETPASPGPQGALVSLAPLVPPASLGTQVLWHLHMKLLLSCHATVCLLTTTLQRIFCMHAGFTGFTGDTGFTGFTGATGITGELHGVHAIQCCSTQVIERL